MSQGNDAVDPGAEFYGSRLLAWHAGTITHLERNQLVRAAWPKTDGVRWVLPSTGGRLNRGAVRYTRSWMVEQIEAYIERLIGKHGCLEAAVRTGHARGLPGLLEWRFKDEFRKATARAKRRVRLTGDAGPIDWRNHDDLAYDDLTYIRLDRDDDVPRLLPMQVGRLTGAERETWDLYQRGLTFKQIGEALYRCESAIRKRVRAAERKLGLTPRPRWRRRTVDRCDGRTSLWEVGAI